MGNDLCSGFVRKTCGGSVDTEKLFKDAEVYVQIHKSTIVINRHKRRMRLRGFAPLAPVEGATRLTSLRRARLQVRSRPFYFPRFVWRRRRENRILYGSDDRMQFRISDYMERYICKRSFCRGTIKGLPPPVFQVYIYNHIS